MPLTNKAAAAQWGGSGGKGDSKALLLRACVFRYLDEVASYVPSCDVQASGQVRQREALVHRTDVSDAVPRVDHHAGQESCKTAEGHNKDPRQLKQYKCYMLYMQALC